MAHKAIHDETKQEMMLMQLMNYTQIVDYQSQLKNGSQEASDYAADLKKAERAREMREARSANSAASAGGGRPGSRRSASRTSANSMTSLRTGSAVSLNLNLSPISTFYRGKLEGVPSGHAPWFG